MYNLKCVVYAFLARLLGLSVGRRAQTFPLGMKSHYSFIPPFPPRSKTAGARAWMCLILNVFLCKTSVLITTRFQDFCHNRVGE